jgi:hypothetical protein
MSATEARQRVTELSASMEDRRMTRVCPVQTSLVVVVLLAACNDEPDQPKPGQREVTISVQDNGAYFDSRIACGCEEEDPPLELGECRTRRYDQRKCECELDPCEVVATITPTDGIEPVVGAFWGDVLGRTIGLEACGDTAEIPLPSTLPPELTNMSLTQKTFRWTADPSIVDFYISSQNDSSSFVCHVDARLGTFELPYSPDTLFDAVVPAIPVVYATSLGEVTVYASTSFEPPY